MPGSRNIPCCSCRRAQKKCERDNDFSACKRCQEKNQECSGPVTVRNDVGNHGDRTLQVPTFTDTGPSSAMQDIWSSNPDNSGALGTRLEQAIARIEICVDRLEAHECVTQAPSQSVQYLQPCPPKLNTTLSPNPEPSRSAADGNCHTADFSVPLVNEPVYPPFDPPFLQGEFLHALPIVIWNTMQPIFEPIQLALSRIIAGVTVLMAPQPVYNPSHDIVSSNNERMTYNNTASTSSLAPQQIANENLYDPVQGTPDYSASGPNDFECSRRPA